MKVRARLLIVGAVAVLSASAGSARTAAPVQAQAPASTVTPAATERALLNQYCVTCHNQRAKTGGLTPDAENVANLAEHPEIWEKVVRKLRAGLMPPAGLPRPAPAATESFVTYLE